MSEYKKIYLTAALKYFEYMKIPLALFPRWIVEKYDLSKHQLDGWVHLEMRRAMWGLPQARILADKKLKQKLALFGYHNVLIPRACGNTNHGHLPSPLSWMILE